MKYLLLKIIIISGFFMTNLYSGEPKITAKYAAIYDLKSEKWIYGKNADFSVPPASTIKLVTAMVILDKFKPDKIITIPESVTRVSPYKLYLKKGEKYTVEELLYALLLRSANDAAHALAIAYSKDLKKFSNKLNAKARKIGLKKSNFVNPHGLPNYKQITTAKDMTLVVKETLKYPLIQKILKTKTKMFNGPRKRKTKLITRNKILLSKFVPKVYGKTGYTRKAGRSFAGYIEKEDNGFIIATFKSRARWQDLRTLAKWCDRFYKRKIKQNKLLLNRDTILKCQKYLIKLGLLNDKADGVFGEKTLTAILKFQDFKNLKVDGIVGPQTLQCLKNS